MKGGLAKSLNLHIMTLTTDPKKWKESIEMHGKDALCSAASAKNVTRTLSRAMTRSAQKILYQCATPYISNMMKSSPGISILTSLVLYGTPSTVRQLAADLVGLDRDLWSLKLLGSMKLEEDLSFLLEGLIYRSDADGDALEEIRSSLSTPRKEWFSNIFTLPAMGHLLANNNDFCIAAIKKRDIVQALGKIASEKTHKAALLRFCNNALQSTELPVHMFLYEALIDHFSDSEDLPIEGILVSMSAKSPGKVVDRLGIFLSKTMNFMQLALKEGYTKALSNILERGSVTHGSRLVKLIFSSSSDVDARLNSNVSSLRLLSVIANNAVLLSTLNENVGCDQKPKLRSASAMYAKVSAPRGISTRSAIEEKLKGLKQQGGKRLRE